MLNYRVPSFQFLIGGFNASEYLDSISLSVPMHEINQDLLWSGQFKINYNLKAKSIGLTEADFDEVSMPNRWRPYQQPVKLNIKGYPSPVFRIENYRYNYQTKSGEGRLTQLPKAVAGDRPGDVIPSPISGTIQSAITQLIRSAFVGSRVIANIAAPIDIGVLDVPIVTRDPWADAIKLAALSWHWLTVKPDESIASVDGRGTRFLFNRTQLEAEVVPDLAAIFQTASKIVVTGARQVPDTSTSPSIPRPKFKTTEEFRPAGIVFPSLGSDTTPILFEQKTIIYQYWDDDNFSSYIPLFANPLTNFFYDIQAMAESGIDPYLPPSDLNIPLQTITIKRQPVGYLFPSVGTDASLTEGEVLIESNLRKLTIKPAGVLFPLMGTNTSLLIEKRENLTSAAIPIGSQVVPVGRSSDGLPQQYESRPKLEPAQRLATRPLKTQVLKGTATLAPLGWLPIFPSKPLVIDFGFLPDAGRANFLALQIASREQWRRNQVLVDLPIPDEWLASGWALLCQCQIGGHLYLMDGCALSIADGVAKFGFTGARMGGYAMSGGIPVGAIIPAFNITSEVDLSFSTEIEIISSLMMQPRIITRSLSTEIIPEIALVSSIAVTKALSLSVIPEISVTSGIAPLNIISLSVIPEIVVTSTVSGGTAIFSIEGNGNVIEGYNGIIFTLEGHN